MSEKIQIFQGDNPITLRFNPEDRSLDFLLINGTEKILRHSQLPERIGVSVDRVGEFFFIKQTPGVTFQVGKKTKESYNLLGVPCSINVGTNQLSPPELPRLIEFVKGLPLEIEIDPKLTMILAQAGLGLLG